MEDIQAIPESIENKNRKIKFDFSFKSYYLWIICFLLILFLGYFFVFVSPKNFPIGEILTISEGSSLRSISKSLEEQHLIKSRPLFEAFVITYGGEKRILPGDYLFEKRLPVFEIARRISKGDRHLSPVKITIPEGFNVSDIAEVVDLKLSKFNKDKFLKLAKADEGYLFPDTYFFFYNDAEDKVHQLMRENFEKKMKEIRPLIPATGKTEKEIIIMASIIEREAKGDSDRELISGILWKRISINMALQVDAAPITYKERGFPESPIANPGLKSIKAAMYPKMSSYLYYLHGKDGEIRYARTFEEHRQNKFKYLTQ
ncbi:MAG: endolytic transglycosylase MltG [bacterium]|nr:endolytic transglycosylase MltG [bacterium]